MEIITSHTNADLDALASMVAAHKLYPSAMMILPNKLSQSAEEFMSLHKDAFSFRSVRDIAFEDVTRIILVDTKSPRRINRLAELLLRPEVDVHIYDHHPWAEEDARGSLEIVETVGAAVTLLVEQIQEENIAITSLEATVFALGIYADTGSLVYPSTTSRDAAAVAFLLEQGANLSVVSEFLERPLSEEQKVLLKMLLMSAERYQINGIKVLIATGAVEEYIVGLSILTHIVAEIEKLDAIFTVVAMEDRVHVVARSNIPQVNVSEILRPLKGGGHWAAASASIKHGQVDAVVKTLLASIQEKVKPPLSAADIMSSPVKTVHQDMSMADVGYIMLRYGHSGLPVVEGDTLVGIISRRDVEKAMHHGLSHAPVKGFMTSNVITMPPHLPVAEVRELMIDNDIGRIPVVDKGTLMGLVSRTDVLRTLHGDYHSKYHKMYDEHISTPQPQNNISAIMHRGLSSMALGIIRKAGAIAEEMGYQLFAAGGVVRDLLLGYDNLDLDLVVEGDGIALAKELAQQLGCKLRVHAQFGTAEVLFVSGVKVDVATARVEYYEYPAALPQVESSSLRQDLYRRDFTINAMAVTLNSDRFGELVDYFGGRKDLQDGLVRVLYNLSFIEDPTRMLRAVRFEQRYHIHIESQTLKLLREAVKQNVIARVSNDRIRDELYHILLEPEAGKMLYRLNEVDLWPQLFPGVIYQQVHHVLLDLHWAQKRLVQWGFQSIDDQYLMYLMALLHKSSLDVAENICDCYHVSHRQKEKICLVIDHYQNFLRAFHHWSEERNIAEMAETIMSMPLEAYPLLLALLENDEEKMKFKKIITAIRDTAPILTGQFLKTRGYEPGPLYREALDRLWRERLNGNIRTEEDEKAFLIQFFADRGVKPNV